MLVGLGVWSFPFLSSTACMYCCNAGKTSNTYNNWYILNPGLRYKLQRKSAASSKFCKILTSRRYVFKQVVTADQKTFCVPLGCLDSVSVCSVDSMQATRTYIVHLLPCFTAQLFLEVFKQFPINDRSIDTNLYNRTFICTTSISFTTAKLLSI